MAESDQGAAPGAVPEIRKPDLQMLLQDLAQWQRTVFDERRQSQRLISEERERSRWEQERLRTELGDRVRDIERQNDVLIRSLSRLQAENERLREDVAVLRAARTNGHAAPAKESVKETSAPGFLPMVGQFAPAPPPATSLMQPSKVDVVLPPSPQLGVAVKLPVDPKPPV